MSFIAIRAEDTPAQAAARAALMEKMNELETQPAQPAQPAPPPIVVTPSGVTEAQPVQPTNPVVVPPPVAPAPSPIVPAPETNSTPAAETAPAAPAVSDAEAQAKARAALEQKTNELNRQDWATPPVAPAPTAAPGPPPVTVNPVKPAPPAVQPEAAKPASAANANFPGKELGLRPIQAPPLPISAAKQAQLQTLLEKYEADQITPEQYHTERARILAEP